MSKRLNLIIFILFVIFLVGCQHNISNEDEKSKLVKVESEYDHISNEFIDEQMNVSLYIDKKSYILPINSITFTIENRGEEAISYGNEVYLDKLQDGVWVQIPYHSHLGFTMEAYELKPGEMVEQEIDVKNFNYELTNGEYRIRKSIQVESEDIVLADKFNIEN